MIFICIVLLIVGICLGSFVNALIWRVHEQETESRKKRPNKAYLKQLSISRGRSMCVHCHHELAAKDLIPVISWLWLRGKCRYCQAPISAQYPIVELITGLLFVISYLWWPTDISGGPAVWQFLTWLGLLVGFMALTVYDLKWMLLPNRIVFPLTAVAVLFAGCGLMLADVLSTAALNLALAVLVGGGIFYLLFQLSGGKWIGGGDVKLGWLLGLVVLTPSRALLMIFLAALAGTIVSLPLMLSGRLKKHATIPFGPFLILGAFIVVLWGSSILNWYQNFIGV